jgi:uncharacterized lipoprotein YddW (UPF0748 family)
MMKVLNTRFFLCFLLLFPALAFAQEYPKREMRAVWIATVENIDWPSDDSLTVDDQKRELIELLDLVKAYHMNAVVFQIRPCADAFYPSPYEPWSQWLTGEQGKAPNPYYDPLDFAIKECRKRGIDIHVWLNPYRALKDTSRDVAADNHLLNQHPEWFLTYGKTKYFNPGLTETRDFVSKVVGDIVRRYDIDAIHMDDYFYPYRIAKVEFPDESTFAAYPRGFASDQKEDWRRDNVNLIIKQIHDTVRSIKPWVEFGISPFGVWRNIDKDPAGSLTKAGVTNYDDLYADILKWQKEGWIDYVVPQIYWQIGKTVADYAVLADWWSRNAYGCNVYVGQAPYRITKKAKEKPWRKSKEIINQIELNRNYPNINGSMFFSAKFMRSNPLKIKEKLLRGHYKYQSINPENSRIASVVPGIPSNAQVSVANGSIKLSWNGGVNTKAFVVYKFRKGKRASLTTAENIFITTSDTAISFPLDKKTDTNKYYYMVTALSLSNTESAPVYFNPSVN